MRLSAKPSRKPKNLPVCSNKKPWERLNAWVLTSEAEGTSTEAAAKPKKKAQPKKKAAPKPKAAPITRRPRRVWQSESHSDNPENHATVLIVQVAKEEKAAYQKIEQLGRKRLQQLSVDNLDLIPEGSGRAVTPDCPQIPRGSSATVEKYSDTYDQTSINTYEPLSAVADYVIAVFELAFGEA
jgi:pyruvate/2-oxoglutarate dehydrogenase complex dihydrolipoamide acyltransferase (E2) component